MSRIRWPWKRQRGAEPPPLSLEPGKTYRAYALAEEPSPADGGFVDEKWTYEASVPLRKLAALFLEMGWSVRIDGADGVPMPAGLARFICAQVTNLSNADDAMYDVFGRMLFLRDEDFPDGIDVYLHIGTAYPNEADDDDESEPE